jgi:hypothetical protein
MAQAVPSFAERFANPAIETDIKPMLVPREGQRPDIEAIPGVRDLSAFPKEMPVRPSPRGPTQRMLDMIPYMNELKYSPQIVERAKTLYKLDEGVQKQEEEHRQKDYDKLFELWKERPKLETENMEARLRILNAQLTVAKNPYEVAELQNKIRIQEQEIAAGKARPTIEVEGKKFELNPATGKYEDVLPKISPEEIKLPAEIGKKWELYQMGKFATRNAGDLAVLANGPQRFVGAIPIFGNAWVKNEYQNAQKNESAWTAAFLRGESGAIIGVPEKKEYPEDYFPRYGDSKEQIAEKFERRKNRERAAYEALGVARPLADQFHERIGFAQGKKEGARQQDDVTGKIRRVVNGYWVEENKWVGSIFLGRTARGNIPGCHWRATGARQVPTGRPRRPQEASGSWLQIRRRRI